MSANSTPSALVAATKKAGISPTTLAVAWVLANPAITAPISGASRPDQLQATLAAVDLKLAPELKQELDELTADYRKGDASR